MTDGLIRITTALAVVTVLVLQSDPLRRRYSPTAVGKPGGVLRRPIH